MSLGLSSLFDLLKTYLLNIPSLFDDYAELEV